MFMSLIVFDAMRIFSHIGAELGVLLKQAESLSCQSQRVKKLLQQLESHLGTQLPI